MVREAPGDGGFVFSVAPLAATHTFAPSQKPISKMITVTVSDIGKRTLNVAALKANGQPAQVDTADQAPSADFEADEDGEEGAATGTVTVKEDGTLDIEVVSGTIAEGKTVRTTQLTLQADADLDGTEVRTITETITVITTRAEAQTFGNVTIGDEVPK